MADNCDSRQREGQSDHALGDGSDPDASGCLSARQTEFSSGSILVPGCSISGRKSRSVIPRAHSA